MVQLSGEELRLGNETEAIRLLTDALESDSPSTEENRPGIDFNNYRLGVAYLRLAETQNCALHPNAEALHPAASRERNPQAADAVTSGDRSLHRGAAQHAGHAAAGRLVER